LLHRGGEHPVVQNLSMRQRLKLKLGYWFGLPLAAAVSLYEAAAGQGGTITVTATLGRAPMPNEQFSTSNPPRSCSVKPFSSATIHGAARFFVPDSVSINAPC